MPRRLTDEPNELRIQDNISGSEIVLYYRLPATAERLAYANEMFRREGRKITIAVGETRQKYGLAILTGIREGDFSAAEGPISSDPKSERYVPAWKELIGRHASDLIMLLAASVFDAPGVVVPPEEAEAGEDAEKN